MYSYLIGANLAVGAVRGAVHETGGYIPGGIDAMIKYIPPIATGIMLHLEPENDFAELSDIFGNPFPSIAIGAVASGAIQALGYYSMRGIVRLLS